MLWPKSVDLHTEDEIVVLSFEDDLPLGDAILGMEFQGTLNDQMRGFYRRCCSAQSSPDAIFFFPPLL
jgi:puromycin-sensitive aminopeptidase